MRAPTRQTIARTGRELAFLLSPLALAAVWLAALILVWTVTASVAITPLVVPALIGVAATVFGAAGAEAWLSRGLLGTSVRLPRWRSGSGFWGRAWAVLADPWLWRAQAYLLLRITAGFAVAVALAALVAGGLFLATLPLFYWALEAGVNIGGDRVRTLGQALRGFRSGCWRSAWPRRWSRRWRCPGAGFQSPCSVRCRARYTNTTRSARRARGDDPRARDGSGSTCSSC